MSDKTLTENWNDTKSALLEGLNGQKKETMSAVLENTQKYLAEAASAGATGAGNVAALNKVILPVIRRVMPTVIANEIVGVQPMTGPVGQIHTLRELDTPTPLTVLQQVKKHFHRLVSLEVIQVMTLQLVLQRILLLQKKVFLVTDYKFKS